MRGSRLIEDSAGLSDGFVPISRLTASVVNQIPEMHLGIWSPQKGQYPRFDVLINLCYHWFRLIPSNSMEKWSMTNRDKLTIVHLSDLHFGPRHGFVDDKDIAREKYPLSLSRAIIGDLRELGIKADFIVISGDLTSAARAYEFNQCERFLDSLLGCLAVRSNKRIIIVPGNHDMLWENPDGTPAVLSERPKNYLDFIQHWYGRKKYKATAYSAFFRAGSREGKGLPFDVAFAAVDSCGIEGPETPGMGLVGPQFDTVWFQVKDRTRQDVPCLKIAVLHHQILPVTMLEPMPEKEGKFSILRDAALFMERLLDEEFHLVLHGHKHDPLYAYEKRHTALTRLGGPGVLVVGAGATGAMEGDLGFLRRNHYNVIDVEADRHHNIRINILSRWSDEKQPFEKFTTYTEDDIILGETVPLADYLDIWGKYLTLQDRAIALLARDLLRHLVVSIVHAGKALPLRAAYLDREPGSDTLFIASHYSTQDMEGRKDLEIELRFGAGCSGKCWTVKEPVIADLAAVTEEDLARIWNLPASGIEITKDLKCVLSFPVFDVDNPPEIIGVLSLDSVSEEAFSVLSDPRMLQLALVTATELGRTFSGHLLEPDA